MSHAPDSIQQVLQSRELRSFLAARFIATIARTGMQATLVWHVTTSMGSVSWLGVLGVVQFLPVIPLALFGGAVADRRDRRNLIAASQGFTALCAVVLCWGAGSGPEGIWLVLGTTFATRIAWTFEFPAGSALLPSLVPAALFPRTVVLASSVRNLAAGIGPLAAGLAIHLGGVSWAFAACAVGLAASTALLWRLERRGASDPGARADWASLRQGIDFVRSRPAILGAMTLDMLAVILADPTVLLAVFTEEILAVGPLGYGLLASAMALGTLAMSGVLLFAPTLRRPGRALVLATLAFGAAAAGFGSSRNFGLCFAALIAAGMADQVSQVARTTLIQLSTSDALRGRVGAVNMVFISASNELGAAFSGFLAAAVGPVIAVVGGGAACIATAGAIAARVPALSRWRTEQAVANLD